MRTNSKGKTVVHRRDMGLGSYPEVSLAEARDKAREMRKQVKNGIDPLEQKKRNRDVLLIQQWQAKTFRECAEVVIENKSHELSGKQGAFWRSSIDSATQLTRIFHTVSTEAAQSGISTALRLFGRLDILSNMSALPALRAPCIYARLRTLGTKRYEISGLSTD